VSVVYLYALIGRKPRGDLGRGLRRERLRALAGSGFHLVVGRLGAAPEPDTSALRRHDVAVRRIAARVDAILPIRFGTTAPDEAEALRRLAPRAIELADRLVRVRGHEQMTLRLFGQRAARDLPAPATGTPASGRGRPGTQYLAERRREHARAAVPELDPIRRALDGLVADERVQRHAAPPLIASAYHLLPRGRGAQYRTRVARAARGLAPLRLTVSGPWPPWAFGADAWP
jgi:hypothetical protein